MDVPVNNPILLPLDAYHYAILHIVGRQTFLCRYRWCIIGITPVLLEVESYTCAFDSGLNAWGLVCKPDNFGIGAIHKLTPLPEEEFERQLLELREDAKRQNQLDAGREQRRAARKARGEDDDIPF